ncbi:hypothetical protein F5887DRAFT_426970 [Amanita rubescens]|nr:hypothetical protein F5887DRAFT_426970 [Amanita rubescens]
MGPSSGFRSGIEERSSQNPASMIPWSIKKVEEMLLAEFDKVAYKSLLFTSLGRIEVHKWHSGKCEVLRIIKSTRIPGDPAPDDPFKSETVTFDSPTQQLPKWLVVTKDVNNIQGDYKVELAKKHNMHHLSPIRIAAALESNKVQELKYNLFCTSPLPIFTSIPAHISAPLILEQGKQNVRVDSDPPANYFQTGMESKYNRWLLSSELPCSYLYLLEKLLQIQGTNIPWWPSMPSVSVDPPSGIFIEAFWDSKTFKNPRRVFASVYDPTSSVFSNDAVLYANKANEYPGWSVTLPKVLSATRPRNVVEVPVELLEYAKKAKLRTADGTFLKTLLEADSCSLHLTLDEIDALLWYLLSKEVSLDGLPLIPLEDGSCAKIWSSQNKQTKYYVVGQRQTVAYDIFPPNRLIHRKFPGRSSQCLLGLTNVSRLNDDGIAQLVKEYIASARGWPEGEPLQTRIASFWNSGLQVSLESISRLHLIQTLHPSEFISAKRMKGPSVIVIEAEKSTEGFDYVVLQQLGMTIVIKGSLPQALGEEAGKKQRPYTCFLEYMQKNEAKVLKVISGLNSSDHEALANWVRSEFSETPAALADVARKLPVWSIHQRDKLSCLGALADTTILPISIPSHVLLPFTDHPVIDWETRMQSVENEGCCTKCVTELLCVSHDTILYSEDDLMAYKQFIKWLLSRERVMGYSLLVPNEDGVLCPAKSLFERHELFLATFKATPKHLLHNGFQDLAESLGKYSLNLGCRLDLAMFMKCANAFDAGNDDKDDKDSEDRPDDWDKGRSKVLYDHFNNLPLSPGDVDWCRKLDQLKFIPRGSPNRRGYEGMDIRKYMQYSHILSLSKITLADYEAICWSQRGHVASQPNSTLCGIYGKPSGKEVVKHLRVLAELGKKYGRQSALLSDLKATYKWLNENVDELFIDIRNANRKSIFLNVDNPDSDQWVWHSALTLIQDLSQDVGGLHGVKGFLRRYNKLLTAAGARSIQKVTAETVATMDETLLCRSRFRDMREHGFEVNVTFKAMDDEHQIPHAHKSWLSINSEYLWRTFVAPGFREVDPGQCAQVNASDYSSLCVKETINWIYVGELPEFIASPSNNQKEFKAKLDLALDMLSLAHRWEITKLHQRLQEFIVNKFLNPYWVKIMRKADGGEGAFESLRRF